MASMIHLLTICHSRALYGRRLCFAESVLDFHGVRLWIVFGKRLCVVTNVESHVSLSCAVVFYAFLASLGFLSVLALLLLFSFFAQHCFVLRAIASLALLQHMAFH